MLKEALLWRLRPGPSLWRLENGLTLTSGTGSEAKLTAGSMDPRSSLELDICLQNLRSLKSPLALAAVAAFSLLLVTTDMPLGPPPLAGLDEELEMTPVTADVGALEAGDATEAGLLTSSSSLSLVSL